MASAPSPRVRPRADADHTGYRSSSTQGVASGASTYEQGSVASHASSSGLQGAGPMSSHTSSGVHSAVSGSRNHIPLSLADALARAGDDMTRALDEVLAERNKYCLEAAKLSGENMRIWNLLGRIRKENETLKALHGGPSRSGSQVSSVAAAAAGQAVSASESRLKTLHNESAAGAGLEGSARSASLDISDKSAGNSLAVRPGRSSKRPSTGDSTKPASRDGATFSARSPVASTAHAGHAHTSSAGAATPTATTFGFQSTADSGRHNIGGDSSHSEADLSMASTSATHDSIMAQRAAAQKRSEAPESSEDAIRAGGEDVEDFDAVDGSSIGDDTADRSAPGSASMHTPRQAPSQSSPWQSRLQAPADITGPSSMSTSPSMSDADRGDAAHQTAPTSARMSSPLLDAATLQRVKLHVESSKLRPNERGRELITFVIAVEIRQSNPQSSARNSAHGPLTAWKVEKLYSNVLSLDARLKQKHGKAAARHLSSAQLPDRGLFRDHAPSKVDQRKAILEYYLQTLLTAELSDMSDVCTFLCTDVIPPKARDPEAIAMEGFLTKKGQNVGKWVTRYYVVSDDRLIYYDQPGGTQLGAISIAGAQIGRQQRSSSAEMDENSYRHAFLILETRPPLTRSEAAQAPVRHVLCAENDAERDEWVDVLVRAVSHIDRCKVAREQAARLARDPATTAAAGGASGSAPPGTGASLADRSNTSRSGSLGEHGRPGVVPMSPPSHGTIASRRVVQDQSFDTGRTYAPGSGALYQQQPPSQATSSQQNQRTPLYSQPSGQDGLPPRKGSWDVAAGLQPANPLSNSPAVASPRSRGANLPRGASAQQEIGSSAFPGPSASAQQLNAAASLLPATSAAAGRAGENANRASMRPAISRPMNGQPIPAGARFGSKDDSMSSVDGTVVSISSKGQDAPGKKPRFWHRFGNSDKSAPAEPRPVFGVPLEEAVAISKSVEGLELPSVIFRCIQYLEKRRAADEEGIYRLSGSSAVIKALKDRFNAEGDVDLLATSEPAHDVHAVAGLLKTFLRELPAHVLTRELQADFMHANDIADRRERVNELGALVSYLPLANYSLLRVLCSHLIKIIERSDVNKMNMRNVGIVFSPTLNIPAGVFSLFLTEFDWIFYTGAKGEPAPRHMEEDIQAPDSGELGTPYFPAQQLASEGPSASSSESETYEMSPPQVNRNLDPQSSLKGRRNRSSWIKGGQLHMGDGHIVTTNQQMHRNNRNSLQYDDEEANRLLGPQGPGRLMSHREADESGALGLSNPQDDSMYEAADFGGLDEDEYPDTALGGASGGISTGFAGSGVPHSPHPYAYSQQQTLGLNVAQNSSIPPSPAGSARSPRTTARGPGDPQAPSPRTPAFPRSPPPAA
ncbi:RhoGAP-domain-containing protein [Ceraceosorus guamensis]|uniref:RhoGAP-domain-containing protein n=1 Tax=Ceraceosorus guamensis TaxID=1522189 RepID=A0A316W6J2_9BASI|nr:RhoGAP-domain-containing protein [Ceraceosorus guamensis]PWN45244.1 RhoGAP-domain-containing protein [Ceraceosorus guamensis]